jgi:hypothetical protein
VTTVNAELYGALIEAGVSEQKACKAAEAIAGYESRLAALEMPIERIDRSIAILTLLLGTATAIEMGNLFLSFEILSRLPHG